MFIYLVLLIIGGLLLLLLLAWKVLDQGTAAASITRTCPVCNSRLTQEERVYADQIKHSNGNDELEIKGCSRCLDREATK